MYIVIPNALRIYMCRHYVCCVWTRMCVTMSTEQASLCKKYQYTFLSVENVYGIAYSYVYSIQ